MAKTAVCAGLAPSLFVVNASGADTRQGQVLAAAETAQKPPPKVGPHLVLNESGYWRQRVGFGPDRISSDALKSDGLALLGANGVSRLKTQTESGLRRAGADPAKLDWREHVLLRLLFDPYAAYQMPPAPEGWERPGFDDAAWVLRRGLFQGGGEEARSLPKLGGWTRDELEDEQFVSLGVQSCCYRARFVVGDPAKMGGLTLRLAYHGGVRAFLNGQEVARGHLPSGALASATPGEDYPAGAYKEEPGLRDRSLGPVAIPENLLVQGVNVLALEVRASRLHPLVMTMKLPLRDHKIRQDKEGLWPHAALLKAELRSSTPAPTRTQPGLQAWGLDVHHRTESTDLPPPGEAPGTVRFVAVRNGTFGAQLAVRAEKELTGLRVTFGELRRVGGREQLPAGQGRIQSGGRSGDSLSPLLAGSILSGQAVPAPATIGFDGEPDAALPAGAVRVFYLAPYPKDGFNEKKLGDERGLGATFPDAQLLARFGKLEGASGPRIFDRLAPDPPGRIPAGFCRPVWLSLQVPASAVAGTYRGSVEIAARGFDPVRLPLEAEVADWQLPDPKDFQTCAACEESPYGVARQYAVNLWSEDHWRLLEASFKQLGRLGNDWLNVPILRRTEFGNHDDSMVRWTRRKDGRFAFDYALLDRYLDLAAKYCGRPQVINFVVMQGMRSALQPPAVPTVQVFDEAAGQTTLLALGGGAITKEAKERCWRDFAIALHDHIKGRGLAGAMYWGFPLEQEDDPELKLLLEKATPGIGWAASPHETLWNATFANDQHYRALVTVRYEPAAWSLAAYCTDRGWKSPLLRLLNPRVGGNFLAMHTVSYPFAYRVLPGLALAHGHRGFGRLGADEWAAAHYDGMEITAWLTGLPVLFTLWPGAAGAESSARFEALLEGVQEAEARIFLEQALEGGRLPADLAKRTRDVLDRQLQETSFLEGALCVHELERYYFGWQERSRALYETASQVCKVTRP